MEPSRRDVATPVRRGERGQPRYFGNRDSGNTSPRGSENHEDTASSLFFVSSSPRHLAAGPGTAGFKFLLSRTRGGGEGEEWIGSSVGGPCTIAAPPSSGKSDEGW